LFFLVCSCLSSYLYNQMSALSPIERTRDRSRSPRRERERERERERSPRRDM
jgi:hypothetical protein